MKIPKPTKRGNAWRIFVNFDKKRYSATFDTEKQAKEWATRKLIELQDAKRYARPDDLPNKSFREAIEFYVERVSIHKKGYRWEELRYNKIMRDNPELVNKVISEIKSSDLAQYRDNRLKEVTNTTVNRELELLSAVFTYAVKELGWCNVNPVAKISRTKEPPPRHRRPSEEELTQLLERCNYSADIEITTKSQQVGWCILFAIETAMRQSEITQMLWKDVHLEEFYLRIPDTKNGFPRNIPLSERAEKLLIQAKGLDKDRVLTVESASVSELFRRFCRELGIKDLRFHDLRHEASTRLAQVITNPADLAKITGHRDVNILVNTYYNPTPQEIAKRLRGD